MTKKETSEEAAPFEHDLERLEMIVKKLEEGDLPLEDALKQFEEGVRLTRACRGRLETVEGRVAELLADGKTRRLTPSTD